MGNRWRDSGWSVWLIALGVALRVGVALLSIGANDAGSWWRFGRQVHALGVLQTYQRDSMLNHPPLMATWAGIIVGILEGDRAGQLPEKPGEVVPFYRNGRWDEGPLIDWHRDGAPVEVEEGNAPVAAGHWGPAPGALKDVPLWRFALLFKLPALLGDLLGGALLYEIWSRRAGRSAGMKVAAAFSCSIAAIAVSAYHCNTDSLLIALCLLSVWLIDSRGAFFAAGLALGAAINVKILPILFIPPLLLSCRSRRDALRLLGGLLVSAMPFAPPALHDSQQFFTNVLGYTAVSERWGIGFFALGRRAAGGGLGSTAAWYYRHLVIGILGATVALGWLARAKGRWNRYELLFVTFALFLILTPGFGVQYTALAGLPLFAVRPKLGVIYSLACGVFLVNVYNDFWTGHLPAYSRITSLLGPPTIYYGLATWGTIVVALLTVLLRPMNRAKEPLG